MKINNSFLIILLVLLGDCSIVFGQNPLFIPPTLTGTNFNLNVQTGFQNFYPANPTPTYGINGAFLSPTIIVNKGDVVTLNVNNGLNVATTMHWHGLHVSAMNDGGPHQIIPPATTWSPSFEILNNAGTFWYHPHGDGKTELHVSKGLAGMFIIHDPAELAAGLPQEYGVDDIPLIVQTKAFDVLTQIAIADHMDTAIFVNGTLNASFTVPSQVVRFRLLNGSSMRSYNFGFSNDMVFYQIATDGGLRETPLPLTRLMLSPGERCEILVDFSTMIGQNIDFMSFASEMPWGVFGGPGVGVGMDTIHEYSDNSLNNADFNLVQLTVGAQTASPITSIPSTLVPFVPLNPVVFDMERTLILDSLRLLPTNEPSLAEGPFGINGVTFHMDTINIKIPLNNTEIWTLVNNTHIAHPFHIHDILFNVIEKSGVTPPLYEQGWKDVVLVLPHDSVKFITKFTTFADEMTPYMYHCHLLHHEDDGMMGTFIVYDPLAIDEIEQASIVSVKPNPTSDIWNLEISESVVDFSARLFSVDGQLVRTFDKTDIVNQSLLIPTYNLSNGMYHMDLEVNSKILKVKLLKAD